MESRAYFFTNMYISDIQRGIQTAHCISDMHMKYSVHDESESTKLLADWATHNKTMIVLNGGYSSHLLKLSDVFNQGDFPWEIFYESDDALNGALTCIGIIIPEYIYELSKDFHKLDKTEQFNTLFNMIEYNGEYYDQTPLTHWLIENLSNYRLA